MSGLFPFEFNGGPIRALALNGEPHFVGKDAAERLGYADPDQALRKNCKALKKLNSVRATELGLADAPPSGLVIIGLPDLMRLLVRSKLPTAQAFERLVFEEILPTIHKTGSYVRSSTFAAFMALPLEERRERRLMLEATRDTIGPVTAYGMFEATVCKVSELRGPSALVRAMYDGQDALPLDAPAKPNGAH